MNYGPRNFARARAEGKVAKETASSSAKRPEKTLEERAAAAKRLKQLLKKRLQLLEGFKERDIVTNGAQKAVIVSKDLKLGHLNVEVLPLRRVTTKWAPDFITKV